MKINVPETMLLKIPPIIGPISAMRQPRAIPVMLTIAWNKMIQKIVDLLKPYLRKNRPNINPYDHLCTIIAIARPISGNLLFWMPTAMSSKKAWIESPTCSTRACKVEEVSY